MKFHGGWPLGDSGLVYWSTLKWNILWYADHKLVCMSIMFSIFFHYLDGNLWNHESYRNRVRILNDNESYALSCVLNEFGFQHGKLYKVIQQISIFYENAHGPDMEPNISLHYPLCKYFCRIPADFVHSFLFLLWINLFSNAFYLHSIHSIELPLIW